MFRSGLPDPRDPASLRTVTVMAILDQKFDQFARSNARNSSQSKTFLGRIDDQAGNSLLVCFEIDDETRAVFQDDALCFPNR
jgi:hypothetical protein